MATISDSGFFFGSGTLNVSAKTEEDAYVFLDGSNQLTAPITAPTASSPAVNTCSSKSADKLCESCAIGVVRLTKTVTPRTIDVVARNVIVVVADDLDGSENAETVTFGFEGITYEIDLGEKNRAKLDRAFAPYIDHGRRVSRTRRRPSAGRQDASRVDRSVVRAWARENGLAVSDRGRISADVMQQYEAAH